MDRTLQDGTAVDGTAASAWKKAGLNPSVHCGSSMMLDSVVNKWPA
jgi:hypothetical protein